MGASDTVRVTYRSLELTAAASLSERGGGQHFLALDTPPPVRTVLGLARDGDAPIAVEVVEAIEVDGAPGGRGCLVREVDRALLEQQPVGSERLASGAGGNGESISGESSAVIEAGSFDEGYAAPMAVPSPVVGDSESSDTIDVSELQGEGDGDDSEAGDAGTDGPGSAKKRRGRKRR
jgi:hypothetical protein